MRSGLSEFLPAAATRGLASLVVAILSSSTAFSQVQQDGQLVEPIFRVAHEEAVAQPPQMASRITPLPLKPHSIWSSGQVSIP